MKNVLTIVGTGFAALAASACCWIPALLGAGAAGSLGIGAALAPYRPYLLGLTAVFLIAGFTMVYRKPGADCCGADGCMTDSARRKRGINIGVMWAIALFAVAMAAYPYIGQARLASENAAAKNARSSAIGTPVSTATYTVEGMDCAACAIGIKDNVEKLPGVASATVDFDTATLTVNPKGTPPTHDAVLKAVEDAGFTARPN
jgi:copper chaperone CopZ